MQLHDLIPILQAAVSPVILISGVGLLLLSLTNRFGRVVDRSRQLMDALRHAPQAERERFAAQIRILSERARFIQLAIIFATVSMLLGALLVIDLFLSAFFHSETVFLSALLFVGCMVSLIVCLAFFLRDINRSLAAFKLELSLFPESRG